MLARYRTFARRHAILGVLIDALVGFGLSTFVLRLIGSELGLLTRVLIALLVAIMASVVERRHRRETAPPASPPPNR